MCNEKSIETATVFAASPVHQSHTGGVTSRMCHVYVTVLNRNGVRLVLVDIGVNFPLFPS